MTAAGALQGVVVLERGWLSSNNVLIHDTTGHDGGATLVDSGHCVHAPQTIALLQRALAGQPLARVLNTHLHSDHCGGNAAIERAFGVHAFIPPGGWDAVQRWDEDALSYKPTGQRCERFTPTGQLLPGRSIEAGGRRFDVMAAPGHDPDSVMLFDARHGLLISADALWENGFGVVFPELEGEAAFDDVAAVLDLIEHLPVQLVVPGHGAPFTDVASALQRARTRLAGFRADPARHAKHAAKVLLKYHLMEEREQALDALLAWCARTPLLARIHARLGIAQPLPAWSRTLLDELLGSGALSLATGAGGQTVRDA